MNWTRWILLFLYFACLIGLFIVLLKLIDSIFLASILYFCITYLFHWVLPTHRNAKIEWRLGKHQSIPKEVTFDADSSGQENLETQNKPRGEISINDSAEVEVTKTDVSKDIAPPVVSLGIEAELNLKSREGDEEEGVVERNSTKLTPSLFDVHNNTSESATEETSGFIESNVTESLPAKRRSGLDLFRRFREFRSRKERKIELNKSKIVVTGNNNSVIIGDLMNDLLSQKPEENTKVSTVAEKAYERVPHMDLTPQPEIAYVPGDRFVVEVYVDREAFRIGETGDSVFVHALENQRQFLLEIWLVVHPRYFEVEGSTIRNVNLDLADEQSEKAYFQVRVRKEADSVMGVRLSASFSIDGRPSGRVERIVDVVNARTPSGGRDEVQTGASGYLTDSTNQGGLNDEQGPFNQSESPWNSQILSFANLPQEVSQQSNINSNAEVQPSTPIAITFGVAADLVVRIFALDASGQRYMCRVRSILLPDDPQSWESSWDLPMSTDKFVIDKMQDFSRKGGSSYSRNVALRGAGLLFFDASPQSFRDAFWWHMDE